MADRRPQERSPGADRGRDGRPAAGEVAVWAKDLTRRFGDFTAVDGVSFEVRDGEIFGFLGPNGAGKTTTIKMLTGLLRPSEGEGRVAGYDVARERQAIRRSIGYMSQLFSLYADLTVEENLDFFGRLYGLRRGRREERKEWALEMAGLTDRRDRITGELPLGWKQRLALGCAVLHEPPILFLDEPTSGVDPSSRRSFWDLIHGLAAGGTTVFVTTHYMQEAEYCDRLALMNRAELIALDEPARLRAGMSEPLLEIRVDDPVRGVEALEGTPGVVEAAMFGRRLHLTLAEGSDPEAARRTVSQRLEEAGVELESVARIVPSLEDVFVGRVRAAGGVPAE